MSKPAGAAVFAGCAVGSLHVGDMWLNNWSLKPCCMYQTLGLVHGQASYSRTLSSTQGCSLKGRHVFTLRFALAFRQ